MSATTPHRRLGKVGPWVAAATFTTLIVAAGPAAADKVSSLAEQLSSLRGEVEDLSAKLARKDGEISDQLKALSRQKTELDLELKREQTRIQKVHLSIKERRDKVAEEQGQDKELVPLFKESIEEVRRYVRDSLPFRVEERLAEIDKLESQQKGGVLSASKAISRLWTFVEDEFRLTRESGLFKQPITVDGKEHLAEVIRIGMVLLYFRVDDQFVGQAKNEGGDWKFETVDNTEEKKMVLDLFTSFKKQIRVGLFRVPARLPAPIESTIAPKKGSAAIPAKENSEEEPAENEASESEKKEGATAAEEAAPGTDPPQAGPAEPEETK